MVTYVEGKHWYTQLPVSWGVEALLVLALLAGTAIAAMQVQGRESTIAEMQSTIATQQTAMAAERVATNFTVTQQEEFRAQLEQSLSNQAAVISEQAATIQQSEAQMVTLRGVADVDAAMVAAYGGLEVQLVAAEQALRAGNTEAYEIAWTGAEALQSRIADLTAQRQKVLNLLPGADT